MVKINFENNTQFSSIFSKAIKNKEDNKKNQIKKTFKRISISIKQKITMDDDIEIPDFPIFMSETENVKEFKSVFAMRG